MWTNQEAEIKADDDSIRYGDWSELQFTQVAGEGLSDHVHRVRRNSTEYRRTHYMP